jgi:flagellar biosynthesis protein FlhA
MNGELSLRNMFTGGNLRQLGAPLLIVMILSMMVLPLPPVMLDLFFTFNIALAVMVLLVSMYTKKPLDFSIFPTVLLVTTLLRLSLNVASTRVVLLEGHTGGDAAGKVIEAFGHFLVGGNYAVGLVVFIILVRDQLRRHHQGRRAHRRGRRASPSTPCPASRWRSTPTSTPA